MSETDQSQARLQFSLDVLKTIYSQGFRYSHYNMNRVMRKPTMLLPNKSDINRAVQAQKMVVLDLERRGIVLSM